MLDKQLIKSILYRNVHNIYTTYNERGGTSSNPDLTVMVRMVVFYVQKFDCYCIYKLVKKNYCNSQIPFKITVTVILFLTVNGFLFENFKNS